MIESLLSAAALVFTADTLLVILLASAFGLFVGSMPGLTATMAAAILVPITFYMDPVPAIAAIISCTAMAITAGDLPGTLLRIPGTPASAAYVEDAYGMTKRGKASLAIGVGITSATIGGLVGSLLILFAAPFLAKFALGFSSFEYFWLALLGLSCAALVSGGGVAKGLLSLLLGLFIAQVGLDPLMAQPRFTFGSSELAGGISFIPAMIGMFALAEILRNGRSGATFKDQARVGNPFKGVGGVLFKFRKNLFRGAGIGAVIGALPGVGGDLAAWVTYALAKRTSKTPEKFGTGHPEGLVEAGATNNAALSSAWIPAMVFGIPGDAVTAIAVGVLVMKGMDPGPQLLTLNPQNFYAVLLVFFLANLLLLPFGFAAAKASRYVFSVPRAYLNAAILLFCIVGSYAINNSMFGVWVMIVLGLVAYLLEAHGFAVAPIILGIVLGPLLETNFTTSMMIARGDLLAFFGRPVAAVLGVATLGIWAMVITSAVVLARRRKRETESQTA
ncbi:tripartite tricarboxylate transporter permease [Psychromarinibacter halotolerans]|uniref:Tripartite tricarboxylate transporter permease n=1 Tax=Psychromarinibacter halotolerans TaxID=1775175 RepID=A0ABV7GZ09_9RHOB|nr:tripartite tricarboxylate transporter permease [Psychromarinibacter halotolerans]MAQ84709.1 C4-dicarboxylate ABC transporter permease [Maritimibacter sp.]MDF0596254.1 tripartite tricarboxylate transporter permease [Psychromarinibacter halotolerans]